MLLTYNDNFFGANPTFTPPSLAALVGVNHLSETPVPAIDAVPLRTVHQ